MESSDENFVWTDASDESNINTMNDEANLLRCQSNKQSMKTSLSCQRICKKTNISLFIKKNCLKKNNNDESEEDINKLRQMTLEITNGNGAESESGKSYKKELQKELFITKPKYCWQDTNEFNKSKKRKHSDSSHTEESKRKHIKTEPESDIDVQHKKKKSKTSLTDNTLNDEHFLNLKVKEEQVSTDGKTPKLKTKKKKRHREDFQDNKDPCSLDESQSLVISNSQCESDSVVTISEFSQEDNQSYVKEQLLDIDNVRTKKKKSKKKKEKVLTEDTIIEDKFSADETVVEQRLPNVHPSDSPIFDESKIAEENSLVQTYEHMEESSEKEYENVLNKINTNKLETSKEKKTKLNLVINKENSIEVINNDETILSSGGINNFSGKIAKIVDRIRFEEDLSQDEAHKSGLENSAQLKKYLIMNPNLKQISATLQSHNVITEDDEVWVMKCPSEIDIKKLKDTSLVLDNKCKLKVDSQTYAGSIDNNTNRVAVLTLEQRKPIIKNIPLCGTVNFRKRIPKPHFMEDNIIVNNQTNFIPLPETKYRHPLFGPKYKSAIKIPKHIALRLNGADPESISDDHEKRKKKKRKHKKEIAVSDNEQEAKAEPDVEVRKKRKRKHSHNNETSPKLVKRLKHDPDSAENWESEKGIEQQLFNF